MKLKGYILAAVAAATYGTNPAFAVPLYADGMNPNTVLFFRYLLGLPILASMLLLRGHLCNWVCWGYLWEYHR